MELCNQDNRVLSTCQSACLFNAISILTMTPTNLIRKTNAELMQVAPIGRKWLSGKVRNVVDGRETQTTLRPHGWDTWRKVWLKKNCQQKETPMRANTRIWKRSTASVLASTLNSDLHVDGANKTHKNQFPMMILIMHYCAYRMQGRRELNVHTHNL